MSNVAQSGDGPRPLDASAVELVAGGFDVDGDWCGTKVPRFPLPPRPMFEVSQILTVPTLMG
jgi:hypothetical protein